jgi:hypothetical protein
MQLVYTHFSATDVLDFEPRIGPDSYILLQVSWLVFDML